MDEGARREPTDEHVRAQLALVLGADPAQCGPIRKTDDNRIAVIDVIMAVTNASQQNAAQELRRLMSIHGDLSAAALK